MIRQHSSSQCERNVLNMNGGEALDINLNILNRQALDEHANSCQIIAVVNQKGGCGKTTTAVNLSARLARDGNKVLLIDSDPQAQASIGLGVDVDEAGYSLYDVLVNEHPVEQALQDTYEEQLKIIPSDSLLSGAQLDLAHKMGREMILKSALMKILPRNRFDYVLIDCSPTLNLVTINALAAAQHVLIPFQTHYYSLQGMKELFYTIETVQQRLNTRLKVLGLLATLFDKRNKINHSILQQVRDYFQDLVFKTVIHSNVSLCEAPIYKKAIHDYKPASQGALDYADLSREIVKRCQTTAAAMK